MREQTRLENWPTISDPFLDAVATAEQSGTGSCNYALRTERLPEGNLVYLRQQREGERVVQTPLGFGRVCEKGIIICGYEVKTPGFLGFLKARKIRTISEDQRESIQAELLARLNKAPDYVEFW